MNHEQLLARLYDAFNQRDIDTAIAGLAADVRWPNAWEGGWLHGREAVRAYWLRQWQEINPTVEPLGFSHPAANVVHVTVHQVVRDLTGAVRLDTQVIHSYRLNEGGLVLRMEIEEPPAIE